MTEITVSPGNEIAQHAETREEKRKRKAREKGRRRWARWPKEKKQAIGRRTAELYRIRNVGKKEAWLARLAAQKMATAERKAAEKELRMADYQSWLLVRQWNNLIPNWKTGRPRKPSFDVKAWKKAWRLKNPDKARAANRRHAERRKQNLAWCLNRRMRERIKQNFRDDTKIGSLEKVLGYTMAELRAHLERQFTKRMTWENRGQYGWHIDHIIPLASFSFTSIHDPEFKAAWALTNLRPLWWDENIKKGAKRLTLL